MGIDPGIGRIGWGLIEESNGKLKALDFGCFETSSSEKEETRLSQINLFLKKIFFDYLPNVVAIEQLFFAANSKTALIVGQARGAILLTASQANLPIFSYTPLQVKLTIVGYGRAEKKQVQIMVKSFLGLREIPKQDDAADALAIAITHAFSYKLRSKL